MKRLLYIIILFFAFNAVQAQRLGFMLGGGATYYYGEMNDRVMTHEKLLSPYFSGGILYRLSPRFDLWANYMHGTELGADSLAIKYDTRFRNLSFRTAIDEVSLNLAYRLLGDRKGNQRRVVPYIFAGIGGFHFKPQAMLNGEYVDLQALGTEGQYIEEEDYPAPYELYQVCVPAGVGIEFRFSRTWALRLEAANHFLFTDYLDDVGGTYPDSASLAAAPNGALAVQMSSKLKDGSFPEKGTDRGDHSVNDSYTHIGIGILWTPFKSHNAPTSRKKKKHNCAAYH